jgi:hypothetical protein
MLPAFPKPEPKERTRKPLRRTSRLKALTWMKRRRPRRLSGPGADPVRLAAVRLLPCTMLRLNPLHRCRGVIEACHEGPKPGVAMKCPDSETVPFCSAAHGEWQQHRGFFRGWLKAARREWMDERIAEVTARYLSAGNRRAR